jgi:hypothetical protein
MTATVVSTMGSTPTSTTVSTADLWATSWTQLRAAYPKVETRLVQLEHERPTRFRALQRLEASAARASARVVRGQVAPSVLLRKLLLWQMAVLAELERNSCDG